MNREEDDIYNVDSYTERELFDILDLFNPSDRELEAKILLYIRKYEDINTPDARKLLRFFHQIYRRFFDVGEEGFEGFEGGEGFEDEGEGEIEGMENMGNVGQVIGNTIPAAPVQLTTNLDYTKGTINPLLKQTYQRTISIDSQYRDSKSDIATHFTLNLTETLKDVVSLKLYAVQIPYTWYTISRSYGSNFVYIKGNSPGINNGYHDISINITPGNYNQSTISGAINASMQKLPALYTDISFGKTGLDYDPIGCLSTFVIDIQKLFNESSYRFAFLGDHLSPVPTTNSNRQNYLSCFLGFNNADYSTCSVYSSRSLNVLDNTVTKYTFDASNNTIYLIQYDTDGYTEYIPGVSTVYQTIEIKFPISVSSQSQQSIYNIVNSVITTDSRLNRPGMVDSSVNFIQISGKDICGNTYDNSGNHYFEWKLKLNRFNGNNIPQSKTVLVVPSVETVGTNPIWVGNKSCFYFDHSNNEINNLVSETYVYTSSFAISGNIYYKFTCNDLSYNVNGKSDLQYNLAASSGYSLNGYLGEINNGFTISNTQYYVSNGNVNIFNVIDTTITSLPAPSAQSLAFFNTDDSKFHMTVDLNKYFDTKNFSVDISNTFLSTLLGFSTTDLNVNTVLQTDDQFYANSTQFGSYSSFSNNLLMVVYPDKIHSRINGMDDSVCYRVTLPVNTTYNGFLDLQNGINTAFRNFSDTKNSYPLQNTFITIAPTGSNNQIKATLNIDINKVLTQNDYTIHFVDNNVQNYENSSWFTNLHLYPSYNLAYYNLGPYSDISGNAIINSDTIDLTRGGVNNQFQLIPLDEGVTGAGNLLFSIPPAKYNRIQLFQTINDLLNTNPATAGTIISYITDPDTHLEYTKIRWNVNKCYTSADYRIVFYDLYSFVSCFIGNSSIRNATWDTTLGWIMGFRSLTEYILSPNNKFVNSNTGIQYFTDLSSNTITNSIYNVVSNVPFRNICYLTGDTTVSVNLYNYFMVVLDDFNPSHLNDGLVTITPADKNVSLPSYANRAKYVCDPVTGRVLNTGITDVASNNLTQNQVYSINQIINTQNGARSYTNSGVYVSDIFGLVPIKTNGYTPGQIYVEFGGTLQAQDRTYFGPVNIHRMAISLVNDRGEIVDLNGANWSLQFICEQLYQTTSTNSASTSGKK